MATAGRPRHRVTPKRDCRRFIVQLVQSEIELLDAVLHHRQHQLRFITVKQPFQETPHAGRHSSRVVASVPNRASQDRNAEPIFRNYKSDHALSGSFARAVAIRSLSATASAGHPTADVARDDSPDQCVPTIS